MNERIREIESQAWEQVNRTDGLVRTEDFNQKFAELIIEDYARKAVLGWMADPAFVQAMDEYYEQKWAHRFD